MYFRPLLHTIDRLPLFLAGAGGVLLWALLAISLEAGVLGLMLPGCRKYRLAFVTNGISTGAAAVASLWVMPAMERWAAAMLGIHVTDPALYQVGAGRPSLLLLSLMLVSFAASILVEGAVLAYYRGRLSSYCWLVALAANCASYGAELLWLQGTIF